MARAPDPDNHQASPKRRPVGQRALIVGGGNGGPGPSYNKRSPAFPQAAQTCNTETGL
jgi:hypothetical protein